MSSPSSPNAYEAVPYPPGAYAKTHPDRTSAIPHLFAMQPAAEPIERCCVLALGCGVGGNIIPMAEPLPEAEFYAVDGSHRQVEAACARISRLRLSNIRIEQLDFADFPRDAGLFHYIIAHGVYSWIAPQVRDRLLEICPRHLAPNGLVYVSHNVLPGWYRFLPIRDFLLFHLRDFRDPQARIQRAVEMLDLLQAPATKASLRFLGDTVEIRRLSSSAQQQAAVLAHDLLGEHDEPLLFRDFVEHAATHGL